jgi:molecular chaperone GrpE
MIKYVSTFSPDTMPDNGGSHAADQDPEPTDDPDEADMADTGRPQSVELLAERISALEAERDRLKDEAATFRDKYLRARADYDNYAKRAQRDADQAAQTAKAGLLVRLIDAAENLEKAVDHLTQKGEDTTGLHMVLSELKRTLKDNGVRTIKAEGVPFNYEHHTAVDRVETDEADEGTVLKVHQRGYLLGDKVLRHAMVTVAAKPAPAPQGSTPDGEAA